MTSPEHAVRYTAEQFIAPETVVGFFNAHHYRAVPSHDHDFYELGIVESGSGTHLTPDGAVAFERGTVIFVPPGVRHEYDACKGVHVLNCFFRAELDELELVWAFRDSRLRRLFSPAGVTAPRDVRPIVIRRLAEPDLVTALDALRFLEAAEPGQRTRAREIAQLLIALDAVAGGELVADGESDEVAVVPSLVTSARDILDRDIGHPWTLTELSARLYVGPFHLARAFARSVGMPPMHYLARRRAERAAALLASTDQSIASVGAAVGWPEPSHFSRRFRDVFGVSPRAYRTRKRPETAALPEALAEALADKPAAS